MMYPTEHCFGCNSKLTQEENSKKCNQCSIEYKILLNNAYFEFKVVTDINCQTYLIGIAIEDEYQNTRIFRWGEGYEIFYMTDAALEMSLEEWRKFIERREKLQVLQ